MASKKPAPRFKVELTERALNDLTQLEQYSIEQWGLSSAAKYVGEIAAALDRLRDNPELLKLEAAFAPGLYFYRVRKHILVCDLQAKTVLVLTVIHTSMDLPTRLLELEPRLVAEIELLRRRLAVLPD